MPPRLIACRARLNIVTPRHTKSIPRGSSSSSPPTSTSTSIALRSFTSNTSLTTKSRPNLPFLTVPITTRPPVRYFTSERKSWLKHEAKLALRYTVSFWGLIVCVGAIFWALNEEWLERQYPTPHDWGFLTRKYVRDANNNRTPKNGEVNWALTMELSRASVLRLEDPTVDGKGVKKLSDRDDPGAEIPGEFIACDISEKSENWRRGYYETIMLAAKAAEHTDNWVRDTSRNIISPPEFVIGPSNPRPVPIPPGQPHAPREEDCEIAYPGADSFYMKILATKGFTPRQKMEAALEYASFMQFKQRPEGPEALYNLALAEATQGMDMSNQPYNPKTYILNEKAGPPSQNLLDALTGIATYKARTGHISAALPIYISLLKARRSLPNTPTRQESQTHKSNPSITQQLINLVSQPPYPPPPSDGASSPWRSPHELCEEASLRLYIGEILYATSSRDDGLSWTRDAVDLAEEQLRGMSPTLTERAVRQTCRECLSTGLENWSKMVVKLAHDEQMRKEQNKPTSKGSMFSFWSGSQQENEGRWTAEDAVVQERVRRTRELVEDITPQNAGWLAMFKA